MASRFVASVVACTCMLVVGVAFADNPTICVGSEDSDGDGVPDECDRCPGGWDPYDADHDRVPDDCDACPGFDDRIDADGDGIPDGCDACPTHADNVEGQPNAPDRPSLYFTQGELAAQRARLQGASPTSPLGILYDMLLDRADQLSAPAYGHPVAAQAFPTTDTRIYERDITVLAFAYLMQDPGRNWTQYKCKALDYVETLLSYPDWNDGANCYLTRHALARGLAIAYDWLYDDLEVATREAIEDKLDFELGSTDRGTTPGTLCGDDPPLHSGEYFMLTREPAGQRAWYWNRPWQNTNASAWSALGVAGHALRNAIWIDYARAQVGQQIDCPSCPDALILPPDGSWHEGVPYFTTGIEHQVPFFMAEVQPGGLSYPSDDHHRSQTEFLTHTMLPDLEHVFSFGNFWGVPDRGFLTGAVLGLSAAVGEYADAYATTVLDEIFDPSEPSQFLGFQAHPLALLAYDETVAPGNLCSLPTEKVFPDLGIATLRNRWIGRAGAVCSDPPGTGKQYVGFKSGWPGGIRAYRNVDVAAGRGLNNGHDHSDQNSFIYADGDTIFLQDYPAKVCPSATQAGCPGCPPEQLGVLCTRWHNTITVTAGGVEYGQIYPECLRIGETASYCTALNLDTESLWQAFEADWLAGEQFDASFSNPHYRHVRASAERTYSLSADVQQFDRDLVFTERYLVVFDRVDLDDTLQNPAVSWYYHTPGTATSATVSGRTTITYTVGAAPDARRLVQSVLWPTNLSVGCDELSALVDESHPEQRVSCGGPMGNPLPLFPDQRIRLTKPGAGPLEGLSVFIAPDGSGQGVTIQNYNMPGGNYRVIINNGDGTRDTLTFSKTSGLLSFLRQ